MENNTKITCSGYYWSNEEIDENINNKNIKRCNIQVNNEGEFCKNHIIQGTYTQEQFRNMTRCSDCKRLRYIANGKICNKCNERGKNNRTKNKSNKKYCKYINNNIRCTSSRSIPNEYCNNHQIYYFKECTERDGFRVCSNFIRGCREILEDTYKYNICQN